MNKFTVAVLQLDSQDDVQKNLDTVVSFIEEAAARGAKLITMPESMNYVGLDNAGHAEEIPGGPTFQLMSERQKNMESGSTAEVSMRKTPMIPGLLTPPWSSIPGVIWQPSTTRSTLLMWSSPTVR